MGMLKAHRGEWALPKVASSRAPDPEGCTSVLGCPSRVLVLFIGVGLLDCIWGKEVRAASWDKA